MADPVRLARHSPLIAALLEDAGWVSPGRGGRPLYVIGFRSCGDTVRLKAALFDDLIAAGVDIRLITIARPDQDGVAKSTAIERTTVAELWLHRSWALAERWERAPLADWTAEGVPPADGDSFRSLAVEAGRELIEALTPLLLDEGVTPDRFRYPTLIWPEWDGGWWGLVCEEAATWRVVRNVFGL
ncbi:hypothetical protein QO010_004607 [Caulobacter ginsengisoli]|uniref:Uncharacterized protein n=1 Tax=Caulobacter ginsengisoli TaxID=400775 RepID=A0ABU0IXS2_9CAUL|nr:hypothetical protein [Caulobacter ginsengisoli]MDQ0466811.1 hypothetical protein [Caulobacter ginsengisoli]